MIVGIDTGGTFTDLVYLDDRGIRIHKVPSTPKDPSLAAENGLIQLGVPRGYALVHGTTVATNALLEGKGAKTALITTRGCRDVLEIARQTRDELYSFSPKRRNPLVPRDLRFEISERLDWKGEVVTDLNTAELEQVLDRAVDAGVESVAVCFLFSYLRPEHEEEVGVRSRRRGFVVSLSHEIAPEYREYERTSTVCANAIVAPVMANYIARLAKLAKNNGAARLSIMQSNGGTLRAEEAASNAIKTVLSGPAGGLVAATHITKQAGFRRILTFDMGGTSTDVALIDGKPETMRSGDIAGMPLLTPMLDIHTIGAGGGSISRLDAGGGLRVGPESAGAVPGPIAYGRGTQVTVTDANVLLGRIPVDTHLAGSLPLHPERVREHLTRFAAELGISPEGAATGILEVVNAQMARALRHISVERGHNPAEYALAAYGGAGPLHACALAESLAIRTVILPRYPGAFSALGLALADVRREYVRSTFAPATKPYEPSIKAALGELESRARKEMKSEGFGPRDILCDRFVEARYVGQSYALRVPFRSSLESAARGFHRAHHLRYGHSESSQAVEIVAAGLAAAGRSNRDLPVPEMPKHPGRPLGLTRLWLNDAFINAPLYARHELAEGQPISGPAIITQSDSTTYIPPEWQSATDPFANLILTRNPRRN
jgi:N-methylhydantoinase A